MKLHSYYYNPPKFHFKKMPWEQTRYFGLEIEVEYLRENDEFRSKAEFLSELGRPWYWYAKQDGSLVDGMEFVSHPHTLLMWEHPRHRKLMEKISYYGYVFVGHTCGVHIHVNRSALTDKDIQKLRYFYWLCNNEWNFSKRFRRMAHSVDNYCEWNIDLKEIESGAAAHRFQAVNITSPRTIEFRAFGIHGPEGQSVDFIDWDRVMTYLYFVDSLIDFVKKTSLMGIFWKEYVNFVKNHYEYKDKDKLIELLEEV